MTWEIQGSVATADDVDALLDAPTEAPSEHEGSQVDAVGQALKTLIDSGVVGGPLHVRAGGHANPDGGPAEGQPNEMITLTVDYLTDPAPGTPPVPEVVEPPTYGDATTANPADEVDEKPTWGDATTAEVVDDQQPAPEASEPDAATSS